MAASTFPPLYNLSQNPEDQASLGRIKAAWDDYSSGWDQETKMTILSRPHEVQIQDYIASSSSDNNERMIKHESGLAPVFTQSRHPDGLNRQQDPSFISLRPVQPLFPSRQNVAQPAAAHPPRANPFTDMNPQPPAGCVPQSDSFSNFLKRKAEENVPNTPSKKPGVSATRAASPVGFDSRSSFLDDELDRQAPNAQPELAPEDHQRPYDAPKECCKLYHERRNAEFREALE
ncbi:hypothetical protein LRP88_00931 [Fusarium phalaenopsidis]